MDSERSRAVRISVITSAFLQAATLGLGCAPTDDPERTGQTQENVNAGTPDNGAVPAYPEVVFLSISGGNTCTGTLVTPMTVLTAAHCFTGASNLASDVTVTFAFDPNSPPFDAQRQHTAGLRGKGIVPVVSPSPDAPTDVALFFLDKPVNRSLAQAHHLSLNANVCPGSFHGTIVGYGGNNKTIDAAGLCPSADSVKSRSRATCAIDLSSSSTSRTAPALNSSVKLLRGLRRSPRFDILDTVSAFHLVSTKADQAQGADRG